MSASRLPAEPAVTRARTAPVLGDPSIESSEPLGGVAVSKRHQPPRSGAVSPRYHGRDHEHDRRCLVEGPVLVSTVGPRRRKSALALTICAANRKVRLGLCHMCAGAAAYWKG